MPLDDEVDAEHEEAPDEVEAAECDDEPPKTQLPPPETPPITPPWCEPKLMDDVDECLIFGGGGGGGGRMAVLLLLLIIF